MAPSTVYEGAPEIVRAVLILWGASKNWMGRRKLRRPQCITAPLIVCGGALSIVWAVLVL